MEPNAARSTSPEPLFPPPYVLDRHPSTRRHAVIVDACVLIPDVLRRTRADFSAITFVGEQKLAALVTSTRVDREVRQHLPEVASRAGCSVELAMHVYETVHRPLFRFVDLPAASLDERVAAVARRDVDDAPLAQLATMLAPSAVLTRDHHLTCEGMGDADWLTTILILKRLAELDAMIWGGSRFVGLSVYLPALAVGGVGRQLMKSEFALGAAIGIAVGAAVYLRPQLRAACANAWTRVSPVLERAMEETTRGLERRAEAEAALRSRLVTADPRPTPETAVARLLVEHWDPVTSEEVHGQLERGGFEISLTATRALLREHPSFVGVRGKGYQFGRSLGQQAP
jgi:hypothetical protein